MAISHTAGAVQSMNISGILVITSPQHTGNVIEQLQNLAGIDIHYVDSAAGRIVVTQEAESISAEVDGLKRIRALPHISLAEMSCHYFEEDPELLDAIPAELDDEALESASVPACLNE
jgi:nitrate reductase NapD